MVWKDKKIKGWRRFFHSFRYAIKGLIHALQSEQNIRIHLAIAFGVIICAYLLSIPFVQKLILFLTIGMVIALELMNTAVERIVNLVTEDYHPLAKQAKDVAAVAVLIASIMAVIIGVLIFYKPLIAYFVEVVTK